MQILIIEDEKRLADALGQIMREQKYFTDIVYNGKDGYEYALDGQYDVIILDIMLPGMNGFEVVRSLRLNNVSTPVILLTARDDTEDKIHGLDSGADDYMTKPFESGELLARIRALTRRSGEVVFQTLSFDDLTLNLSTNDLSSPVRSIRLGHKEFEIMKVLMSNPRILISKEMLINKIWGADSNADDNNVEAYISFLRKKMNYLGTTVKINSVRKAGYHLAGGDTHD